MFLDETPYEDLWERYEMKDLPLDLYDFCFYFSEVGNDGHLGFFLNASKKNVLEHVLSNAKKFLTEEMIENLSKAKEEWDKLSLSSYKLTKKEKEVLEKEAHFEKEDEFFAEHELDLIHLLNNEATKLFKEKA